MLYADDAGVVSKSPEQLRKIMDVIVTVCAAFGLTVSEAKTEITCLRIPRGDVNCHTDLSIEIDRRIRNMCEGPVPRRTTPSTRRRRAAHMPTGHRGIDG